MLLEPPNTCYSNVLNHGFTLNIENSNDLKLLGKQDTGAQDSFSADPDNVFSKRQTFSEHSNKLVMFLIGKIRYLTRNDTLLKKKVCSEMGREFDKFKEKHHLVCELPNQCEKEARSRQATSGLRLRKLLSIPGSLGGDV